MFPILFVQARRTARLAIALACAGAPAFGHAAAPAVPQARGAAMPAQYGAEQPERQMLTNATRGYLEARDYKGLEALYAQVKGAGQRTPSGLWKQAPFYNVLRQYGQWSEDAAYWAALQGQAKAWQRQYPHSVPARLFEVYLLLRRTEASRGTAFYAALTEKQRRDLSQGSAAAMRLLDDMQAMADKAGEPEWHRAMLSVFPYSNGFSEARYRAKIGAALARHPDYHEAYFTAALYSLAHWNGAPDAVDLIARALDNAAGTEQGAMYARMYWYMDQSSYQGKLFEFSPADWPTMRASFDVLVAQYPDPWNLNAYAYFACRAGDTASMARLLARIGDQVEPLAWGDDGAATQARCAANTVADPQFESKQAAVRNERLRRLRSAMLSYAATQHSHKQYQDEVDTLHRAEDMERGLGWVSMPLQYNLAAAFVEMKRYEEAVSALGAGLRSQPAFPDAYWMRGRALEALGRKDEARADFEKGAGYLRAALPAAWAKLNATQRANVALMQGKFREYGFDTPIMPPD
ncbi:MAG TPA: hypothetical protein VF800_03990 [Telluria sp.]|jgi:hypothetical protein